MPRDYTGADFILRDLPSTRERQEQIREYEVRIERANQRRSQERLTAIEEVNRVYERMIRQWSAQDWSFETTWKSYTWEGALESEREIEDPILRKIASLNRRFKAKTLRKTNVQPIPLP